MDKDLFKDNLSSLLSSILNQIITNPLSAIPTVTLPGLAGDSIGLLLMDKDWDNWSSNDKSRWVSYSLLLGFLLLGVVSIPVAYFCTLYPQYIDAKMTILYYAIVAIWIFIGLMNLNRTRLRRRTEDSRRRNILGLFSR